MTRFLTCIRAGFIAGGFVCAVAGSIVAYRELSLISRPMEKREESLLDSGLWCQSWAVNLGDISADVGQLSRKFVIENRSGNSIRILGVNPDCMSCTSAVVDRNVLKPSEAATVDITFRTDGVKGHFTTRIIIIIDRSAAPVVILLSGNVT